MVALLACSGSKGKSADQSAADQGKVTLFVTTELEGTIEPCGCTTDPLGDLARTTELIASARAGKGAVVHLDGGSLLFSKLPIPEKLAAQEKLKADLLRDVYRTRLEPAGIGLGPYDLAAGKDQVSLPRQAANVPASAGLPLAPPKVVTAGGVKVGVFGVVAPEAVASFGIEASDPAAAAAKAVKALREDGAVVVVGIAHMDKGGATALAREVEGIDFLVVGKDAPTEPARVSEAPTRIGDTWLVQPADRGQVVSRIELTVRAASGSFADALGEARVEAELEGLRARIPKLREDLAGWQADPSADPSFLATKKTELAELEARAKALEESPLQIPAKGNYFTFEQVAIAKELPCSEPVVKAKQSFDLAAGQANVVAATGQKPAPVPPGQAGYVGAEECSYCHADAVKFWETTRHFQAWETLEEQNKQFNLDCIGCHVTGWEKPGGATLAVNESLRDVQCETCHGPGSIHAEAGDKKSAAAMLLTPPEELCATCHSPEHSDTFDYEAYLRDVTGEGHGEAFRKKLGDGPTGHELRRAGLEAAGLKIGEGCPK